MLMCNETVTLVQLDDNGEYQCVALEGVSWYAKTAITNTAQGLTTANVLQCRIPSARLPAGVALHKGDFIVRGEIARVDTLNDIKDRERFAVTAIGDNRRGCNPHWAVSGA